MIALSQIVCAKRVAEKKKEKFVSASEKSWKVKNKRRRFNKCVGWAPPKPKKLGTTRSHIACGCTKLISLCAIQIQFFYFGKSVLKVKQPLQGDFLLLPPTIASYGCSPVPHRDISQVKPAHERSVNKQKKTRTLNHFHEEIFRESFLAEIKLAKRFLIDHPLWSHW